MDAANHAVSSPLLEDASVKGARGVIINVTGGPDLSLIEVSEASAIIQEAAHEDANIIFGAVVDPKMEGKVKITGHRHRLRPRHERRASTERVGRADASRSDLVHGALRTETVREGRGRCGWWRRQRRAPVDSPVARSWRCRIARRGGRSGGPHDQPRRRIRAGISLDVPAFLRRQHEA